MSDHKRAREYFAKAARLDPEDVEAVFWNGWYQYEAGDLVAARRRTLKLESLHDLADKTIWSFGRSWASATCKVTHGDLAGALKSYNDGLAIADRLARSDPGNAGWQRDLSASYEKVEDVQSTQGDLAGALKSYNDGLAIQRPSGEIRSQQRRLAARSFGVIQQGRQRAERPGRHRGRAEVLSTTASRSADRLAKSDPGNAGWQRDLSVSYEKSATCWWRRATSPAR